MLSTTCELRESLPYLNLEQCSVRGWATTSGSPEHTRRTLTINLENLETSALRRLLSLDVPDARSLDIQLNGMNLLHIEPDSVFRDRPIATPRITIPLTLEPGIARLSVEYAIHANGRLSASLYSTEAWAKTGTLRDLGNGLILGLLFMLACVSAIDAWNRRAPSHHIYSLLVLAEMGMLLQTEGYAFAYLWPNAPSWNAQAPMVLASAVLALHALFATVFLELRQRHARLYRLHLLIQAALALNLLGLIRPDPTWVLIGVSALYIPVSMGAAWLALNSRVPGASMYATGTVALLLFGIGLFVLGVAGDNPFPAVSHFHYPKVGLLLEALCFSAAMVNRLKAHRARVDELRMRQLAEAQELLKAEHARRTASDRARESSMKLASASHDIAQPLASLDLMVQVLRRQAGQDPIATQLENTLRYARSLLNGLMERGRIDILGSEEQVSFGHLYRQLSIDLGAVAEQRAVRLRFAPLRARVNASELVLTRILRNLLSNAILHGQPGGKVLMGARHRTGGWELQILNQGPGIPAQRLAALQLPFERGNHATEGFGLGLYIVRQLCTENGYRFLIRSDSGKGCCACVFIPDSAS